MLKNITFFITVFAFVATSNAQYLWYENESNTDNIQFDRSRFGTFSTNNENPQITGINTNSKVSKFVRNSDVTKAFAYFKLTNPIEVSANYRISFKAYIDAFTENLGTENTPNRIRLYLSNTTNGEVFQNQLKFEVGKEWQEFVFNIDSSEFTAEGLANGGYDEIYIGYGNGQNSTTEISYYIDSIYGSTLQEAVLNTNVEWMQGSWGARLYVRGGETLDDYVGRRGYDYVAGAHEIVDNYTTIGHVITNATNNAKSFLFTLRTNENLDAVIGTPNSIITEEFVPSIENEQVIIDVIKVFKDAGKRVILYFNTLDPAERSSEEGAVAWNAYVDKYFGGNVHKAWVNLCEGYVKRFAELGVDGYWLDAFNSYPGNNVEKSEFIQMFRNVDPNLVITANLNKTYFTDANDDLLLVDTDGVNDPDERDYRIIKLDGNDPYSDFTPGHITPLATGAPPNSWAYEEFTISDIKDSPASSYNNGSKLVLKHLFMPIRSTWSSERSDLMFEGEQAYRFVKNITDAGGAITFSNTIEDGTISEDENIVMKYVNEQMLAKAAPTAYIRPEGAYLVSENTILGVDEIISKKTKDFSILPNPVVNGFEVSEEFVSAIVYSFDGQKVLEFQGGKKSYDVSTLETGSYFLKIIEKKGVVQIIRFVKE